MKIRTQLLIGAALFGAVLLVIAASVAMTTAELGRIEGQATLTGRIVAATNDLDYIANEYLLYGEPKQLDYWSGRYAALSADIANLSADSSEEQALVRAIADDQQRLQAVFDGIVAGSADGSPPSADQGEFQVAWSRVGVQSQALEYDASRLSALLEDRAAGLRFRNTLLISALLAAFAILLLAGFAVVGGRTLRSVNALQAGADAIGAGDLGHRIDASSDDEVGDLARSFNRMAADLATVTASRAELEAAQAELRSVALFPLQNPHPVLRTDQDGRLLFSNPAGAALLGDLEVGERLPAPLCRVAREACAGGRERTIEQDFGTTAYAIAVVPLPELGYVNLYFADITERKRAETALREREQTLQSVFRAAPVGIGIASDRVIGSANEHLCRMTGYAEEELIGRDARMLYLSDEAYALTGDEKSAQTLENGIGVVETQWQRKDGRVIDILLSSSPMDPSTPFENVVFVALDITDLHEKEAALRESEAKYRNAVELSPDAILIHQDGLIVFANPAAAALVGAEGPDALAGRPILDLVHPDTRELAAANVELDLRGEESPITAIRVLRDDGTTVPVQGRGAAIPFGGRPAVQVVLRDVTGVRRAQQALRESEERYRELVEQAGSVIIRYDRDGRLTFVNEFAQRFFGFSAGELLGRSAVGTIIPETESSTGRDLAGMVRDLCRSPATYAENENENITKDGRRVWVRWANRPIVGPGGEVREFLAIGTDITDRKKAEAALFESEANMARAQSTAHLGNWAWDLATGVISCSDEHCRLYGLAPGDYPIETFIDLVHEDDRQPVRDALAASLDKGTPYDVECRVVRPDGVERILHGEGEAVRDSAGSVTGMFGIAQDITERRKAEEALADDLDALTRMHALSGRLVEREGLEPLLQEIMETAVAIMGGAKGTLQLLEGGSLSIAASFGHDEPFLEFFAAAEARASACGLAMAQRDRVVVPDVEASPVFLGTDSLDVLRAAGVRAVQSTPLLSRAGETVGVLTTHWGSPYEPDEHDLWRLDLLARQAADLIEHARAVEALRAYAEDLHRSNEDLERFAYVSSHDLQEPLRSIVSFSQLLERKYRGKLDADADEYIDFIVEGGNRMQTLILDLLAYSRVNSTAQERRPTDVEAVMAAVERHLDLSLREAGATLTHDPLPTVTADPLQLEQVFENLVSNAIKFRKPDLPLRVHVGARQLDGFWEFSVKDNGIGIEEEYFEKIFVIFQRLHTKDAYPGTGIGLAIVKRIVDRHGGTVRVESTPGEGSTFIITLPAA